MLLVDGYNFLHVFARGRATESERERMLQRLEIWCREGGRRARVVFDPTGGMRRREERGSLEIRVVAQGRTADEELLAAIAASGDRTQYVLISNDREITSAAKRKHLQVIACEDFARTLQPPAAAEGDKGSGSVPPGEVDYWMKEFGIDEGRE